MEKFDLDTADATVRVDLGGSFSYDQIRDMVRAVCNQTTHTQFYETTETVGGQDFPVLAQQAYMPAQNLFVAPGREAGRLSFAPDQEYTHLTVVAHEQAERGTIAAVRVYPEGRGKAASELAGQLSRAFDKDINEFQASEYYRQQMETGSPLQAGSGTDGARDRTQDHQGAGANRRQDSARNW
ncbi:hypothetical protein [Kribbella sp. NPDC048928]|uniref:hypothetical protein n=1 Tax=Kribbella sp. NPDC048928 TaxID=3364111 RepID=UPI003721F205